MGYKNRVFRIGHVEFLFGWASDQPNREYVRRFWGLGHDALFLGMVTYFEQ